MKTWNAPVMQELDVKLTASSGVSGTTEADGYLSGTGWVYPTYDSSTYEKSSTGDCAIPKKDVAES